MNNLVNKKRKLSNSNNDISKRRKHNSDIEIQEKEEESILEINKLIQPLRK